MVWCGLLKRERRNDLERVYQDHSWNWNATFRGLSNKPLCCNDNDCLSCCNDNDFLSSTTMVKHNK